MQILAYHVIPDRAVKSSALTDGQVLPTLDDSQNLTVRAGPPGEGIPRVLRSTQLCSTLWLADTSSKEHSLVAR
jgi:hypothetical protein